MDPDSIHYSPNGKLAPMVITGTTSGIGASLAIQMAKEGRKLILVNRSRSRTQATLDAIEQSGAQATIDVIEADLSTTEAVRSAADRISRLTPQLSVLFNNAGVLLGELAYASSGNEMHYQINTVAPYLLSELLKPQLQAAAEAGNGPGPAGQAVIVNTNSSGVDFAGNLRVEELRKPSKFRKLVGPYAQSKLALLTLSQVIAPELEKVGILIRDAEPGPTKTVMTAGSGMQVKVSPKIGPRAKVDYQL
jgi:NAD(P)-dependent dehydrogenase (short-subunit alcohol dehydrogenase family)